MKYNYYLSLEYPNILNKSLFTFLELFKIYFFKKEL